MKHIIETIRDIEELGEDSYLFLIYDDEQNKLKWEAFREEDIEGWELKNEDENES